MSLALVPAKVAKVIDPICDLNRPHFYVALKGGSVVSYQRYPSLNFTSSTATVQCNPPDESTIIDKKPLMRVSLSIAFVGTSASGNLLQLGTNDGPAFAPLQKIINTSTLNLGNDTMTQGNNNEIMPVLLRFHNNIIKRDAFDSVSALMPDSFQDYGDWVNYGSARNPLAFYGENSAELSRGGMPIVVNSNLPTSANITMIMTEPIAVSPLDGFSCHESAGMIGIRNIKHTFNFSGDLTQVWSHSQVAGNNMTSITVTFNSIDVLYKYISPDPVMNLPLSYNMPYYELTAYDTQGNATLATGATTSYASSNFQLTAIPNYILVWFGRAMNAKSAYLPDSYAIINSVNVLFNNTNYLSGAQQQDLYRMAVRNGLNMSWAQWSQYCGSILKLKMGTDIGLRSDQAPGLAGNFQFQVTVNVTNLAPADLVAPTLYCWPCYEGVCNVIGGNVSHQLGVLDKLDVLQAQKVEGVNFNMAKNMYGGNFFGDLWDGVRNVSNKVADVAQSGFNKIKDAKLASKLLGLIPDPRAQAAAAAAQAVGLGACGYGGAYSGGDYSGGDYSGGVLVEGGKAKRCPKSYQKLKLNAKKPCYKKSLKKEIEGIVKKANAEYRANKKKKVPEVKKGGKKKAKKSKKSKRGGAMVSDDMLMKRLYA